MTLIFVSLIKKFTCCNYQVKLKKIIYSHALNIISKNLFKKVFMVIPFEIKQLELTLNVIKSSSINIFIQKAAMRLCSRGHQAWSRRTGVLQSLALTASTHLPGGV